MAQRQQFLNFDKPEFVDDFVYTPPFEMMDRALKVNQEGMDTAIATANLFNNLNIDYIDDEQQRQRVGEIIKKYAGQADDVAALIRQDPSKWRQQGAALSGLKNQLAQDFQYGEIYRTQKNAENWKAFQAELDKNIKDSTTRQALKEEAMQKWRASYKDADGNYKWNTALYDKTQGIDRPDMVAYIKGMGIKQDEMSLTKDLFNGKTYDTKLNAVVGDFDKFTGEYGYIREVKESEKDSYAKVQRAIDGYMQMPETIAFEKQQERLRQAGLLDERYYDDKGNRLSIGESSWAGQAQMALQLGERNSERSDKWRTNETELYYDKVAREKQKEQDEIEANLFTVQTPLNNQGAAFNNEMNAILYTGTTNADGTQTAGLLKQIFGDKASIVEATMRKQADPLAYLIDRINAGKTMGEKTRLKATGENKKQLLERLQQYRNRELRLRASGTTPLATVVGAEESVRLHKIFNNSVNTHYETISYKVGDGDATPFRDFNNGAMMYEVSPIKVNGKEVIVPRVGRLGRNKNTGEIKEIPATMSPKERLNYEPVLGASLIKNSGTIQPVNQGSNKQGYVGWNNIQFEFGRKKGAEGNTQQVLQASTPMDLSKGGLISIGANTPETRVIENPTYSSPTVNSTVTQTTKAKLADIGSYFQMTPQEFQSSVNGKRTTGFISGDAKIAQQVTSAWEKLIKDSGVPNTTGSRDAFFSYLEKEYPGIKASYQRGIADLNDIQHSWQTSESAEYNTGNHIAPTYNYNAPLSDLFK